MTANRDINKKQLHTVVPRVMTPRWLVSTAFRMIQLRTMRLGAMCRLRGTREMRIDF
jgi:hypothetical protein